MTTINTLISDALIDLGRLSPADTIDSNDLAHAIRVVNRMVGQWATQNLLIPATVSDNFSLTAGTASYTIGSGGSITTRAMRIVDNCYLLDSGGVNTYPLKLINQGQYNRILDKTVQGLPEVIFYDSTITSGTLYFYPVPGSTYTAYIESIQTLHATLTDGATVTLPLEYEDFFVLHLRNRLSGSFGIPVTSDMRYEAMEAMDNIKRLNFANRSETMSMPAEFSGPVRVSRIETG